MFDNAPIYCKPQNEEVEIMVYVKVVRRIIKEPNAKETEHGVYDVYVDVGFFSPLIKKWEILKSSLTRKELMKYMIIWLADTSNSKIYVTAEY